MVSTLSGIFDVMTALAFLPQPGGAAPNAPPFKVHIVGLRSGPLELVSRLPVFVHRSVADVDMTDIVIVPSVLLGPEGWVKDRHPELVEWLRAMHRRGALLCSACSGIFLIAETGLFDGMAATVHFGYARAFAEAYPEVPIHPERVLVVSGKREELITSGASMTWHDLGPLSHRPPRRSHGGADGSALLRASVASRRAGALHRFRGPEGPWRLRHPVGAKLCGRS